MKIWLFALLQSLIATLGLAAFFLADNVLLASSAAVMAALLGIAQPLIAAYKNRRLQEYQDVQWNQSFDATDEQINALLQDCVDPPLPHRATIVLELQRRFGDRATGLIDAYDGTVKSIDENDRTSPALVARFADETSPWSLGPYLQGLAAVSVGDLDDAHQFFCAAKSKQQSWILPWLGWASTAYRLDRWDEIRNEHPHINGVQLLPYGAGNEETFLKLSESQRDELTSSFQQAATSLGNYYTIAEFCNSKVQMTASYEAYKKVA